VESKITGGVEAKIIALSCSSPPSGRSKWSLKLLADKSVELQYVDSISHEAVGRLLKKRTTGVGVYPKQESKKYRLAVYDR